MGVFQKNGVQNVFILQIKNENEANDHIFSIKFQVSDKVRSNPRMPEQVWAMKMDGVIPRPSKDSQPKWTKSEQEEDQKYMATKLSELRQGLHKVLPKSRAEDVPRRFLRACRLQHYIRFIWLSSAHFWMDGNCLQHVYVSLLLAVRNHPRFKRLRKLPDKVAGVLLILKELSTLWKLESMTSTLRHLARDEKTGKNLNLSQDLLRQCHNNAYIKYLCSLFLQLLNRRLQLWKRMMTKTFATSQRLQLPSPEHLLGFTLSLVTIPSLPNTFTDDWVKLTGLPCVYGFPTDLYKDDPKFRGEGNFRYLFE